ncbi:hypothetical protein [Halotia branconii]|uniref:Uncharacterized protein n=1 Tax=Halotia branconii CENA392 TaxID=1539056 RepID=A0AAJ6PCR3_9CYAN|nr:hypothetical protein [Halotia branconii]WGV29056.1 hypothetical protein QI031_31345 [Halotia branconii CENA392]
MSKYVCSSKDSNVWHLPPEAVAQQTFQTEEEAIQWFKQKYPERNLDFSGYEFDGNYYKNYVSDSKTELGYINQRP